uniref:Calponin-homology (CH) domain-containing protein n=1 Tax=Lates calcarifer TaxID=8187 RepID=A0A4W6DQJ2_LATCA
MIVSKSCVLLQRCPPSFVSDLFSDLRDGSLLLDLLEVMSGQGQGVFQTSELIKLVNINIPDIIDGRPSIILGLVWTIILRCHVSTNSKSKILKSSYVNLLFPAGRIVKDFKSSWRSGEAFLAILCSLRPQLVDLSLVQSRSNQENLEEAFHLAERELHIPRLLEPQDVDVKDPDEKSIMTYVAQFLQYSNDMPAPDDYLQVSSRTCISDHIVTYNNNLSLSLSSIYTKTYLAGSFTEQRRPVMTLLTNIKRCPELSREQQALRAAWDRMEEEVRKPTVDNKLRCCLFTNMRGCYLSLCSIDSVG